MSKRSFVPPCPAPLEIRHITRSEIPGEIEGGLSRFCAYRSRRAGRSAVRDFPGFRSAMHEGLFPRSTSYWTDYASRSASMTAHSGAASPVQRATVSDREPPQRSVSTSIRRSSGWRVLHGFHVNATTYRLTSPYWKVAYSAYDPRFSPCIDSRPDLRRRDCAGCVVGKYVGHGDGADGNRRKCRWPLQRLRSRRIC